MNPLICVATMATPVASPMAVAVNRPTITASPAGIP